MTIPAPLAGRAVFCTVPGARKREAVRRMLNEPMRPACMAGILRQHLRCTLYLDAEFASEADLTGYRVI